MNKSITQDQQIKLLKTLNSRFENNMSRHNELDWTKILTKLENNPNKLWSINEMEISGGEPDIVDYDTKTKEFIFFDCAAESPKQRRSLCYDKKALESRKKFPPKNDVISVSSEMGIELLTELEYRHLQTLGEFDKKTSSWLKTPTKIRNLGGAIFGDFRFGHVFIYHNGAESYYAGRGFRGSLRI